MDTPSAFATPTIPTGQPAPQPTAPVNPFADQLAVIKNEDGTQKYDSPEKALEALKHSQDYIPQLQQATTQKDAEIARLTSELAARSSVEDVVSRLTTPAQAPVVPEATPQEAPQSLTPDQVSSLVQQELARSQQANVASTNAQKVNDALVGTYGDKANATVIAKAAELNTTPQALEQLASQSPEMVLALFNTQTAPAVTMTHGSVNIQPTAPVGGAPLTAPEKSVLSGATSREQADYMLKVQADVYAKFDVTT